MFVVKLAVYGERCGRTERPRDRGEVGGLR